MNRREAIVVSVGLLFSRPRFVERKVVDFDPFFVWRQTARFERDVASKMQQRLAMAMCEKIDRDFGVTT